MPRSIFAILLLATLAFSATVAQTRTELYRVCYFTNWAQYRGGDARFTVANIDADLCTHIIYSFAKINKKTVKMETTEWNDHTNIKKVFRYFIFKFSKNFIRAN